MKQLLNRFFNIEQRGSTIKTELIAGFTTFVSMCYMLAVVPGMMTHTGLDFHAAFVSTVWMTVIATLIMGLWANFPMAVGPGLGITAYFSYIVCGTLGFSWQAGFAAVLISGVIFAFLTFTKIQQLIIDSIPLAIKEAIPVGIGLFIAFVGMKNSGIIVANPETFVTLGKLTDPNILLTFFCLILISVLLVKRVTGAMIIGMVVVTIVGISCGVTHLPDWSKLASLDSNLLPTETLFKFDFGSLLSHGIVVVLFTFCFIDLFDNLSTLIALSNKAGFMDKDGKIRGMQKALMSDATATIASSFIGNLSAITYLESATGIGAGGKTGLTAVTVAVLFALSLFLSPLLAAIPVYATSAALIIVGAMMMSTVSHIDWNEMTDAIPCFLLIIGMPLTFNIATGLGLGFIAYCIVKLLAGKTKELNWTLGIIAALFLVSFALR